jgi:hypothetical protein
MFKKLLPLLFLFAGFQANASIIDNGPYTTDTESGLDWLDVTLSIDRSYDDVSTQFGSAGDFEGWRYASGLEFEQLWNNISGVDESSPYGAEFYDIDETTFSIDPYVAMLGDTYDAYIVGLGGPHTSSDHAWGGVDGDGKGIHQSFGILADSFYDHDGVTINYYLAGAYDADEYNVDDFGDSTNARAWAVLGGVSGASYGSWLVRGTISVPEPSIIALFCLGLVGIGFARRRQS